MPESGADAAGAPDRAAAVAARQGDQDAFRALVARYERRLFGLALMITRDPSGAEEVAQDAFVRAFTHLHLYDEARPFYPWLSTIAVRLGQNWLRKRQREYTREAGPPDDDRHPAEGDDPLGHLIADDDDRRLWRAVQALPSGERTAVILHYRQEMSVADIAGTLGVTSGTIKAFLFRARRHLRSALAGPPAAVHRKDPT